MSYSSAKPKPPWVCTHISAANQEASAAKSLAMLASGPTSPPASYLRAASCTINSAARDRELHALVLPDRPIEQHALLGIARRLVDKPFGVADAFGGDEDALGVHAGQDVAETLALLADQVFRRHAQVVEENLRGGVVHHGADRRDRHRRAVRQMHVDD